ncbi:MAG: alpha/beta hydrolase [Coriobacteriales bacterium]|jgi:monoterpene epsilon-lactone hydrolase
MSLRFERYKKKTIQSGIKARMMLPLDEQLELARKAAASFQVMLPKDSRDFTYELVDVEGTVCIVMHNQKPMAVKMQKKLGDPGHRAILYAYGNGMLMPPEKDFLICAQNIGIATQRDVWLPLYPTCLDASVVDAVEALDAVHARMLDSYDGRDIAFYGVSSGASLLMSMLSINSGRKHPHAVPGKLIAISPLHGAYGKLEREKMEYLEPVDMHLSYEYVKILPDILRNGRDDVPEHMINGNGLDCTGFPETRIYLGTYELMSAKSALYEQQLKKEGVEFEVNCAEGMPHCYCMDIKFPEATEDYEEILATLQ